MGVEQRNKRLYICGKMVIVSRLLGGSALIPQHMVPHEGEDLLFQHLVKDLALHVLEVLHPVLVEGGELLLHRQLPNASEAAVEVVGGGDDYAKGEAAPPNERVRGSKAAQAVAHKGQTSRSKNFFNKLSYA